MHVDILHLCLLYLKRKNKEKLFSSYYYKLLYITWTQNNLKWHSSKPILTFRINNHNKDLTEINTTSSSTLCYVTIAAKKKKKKSQLKLNWSKVHLSVCVINLHFIPCAWIRLMLCVERGTGGVWHFDDVKAAGCVFQWVMSGEKFILPQKDWIPSFLYSCSLRISLLNSNSTERQGFTKTQYRKEDFISRIC